jgi:hypothetical protein
MQGSLKQERCQSYPKSDEETPKVILKSCRISQTKYVNVPVNKADLLVKGFANK